MMRAVTPWEHSSFRERQKDKRSIEFATVEKESLVVVWSTEKFRSHLYGSTTVVASDCQHLQWLSTPKTPSSRLARWALRRQGMNLRFTYIPRKQDVVADTLSRPFCDHTMSTPCSVCVVTVDLLTLGYSNFRREQLADPDIKKILDSMEDAEEVESRRSLKRGFSIVNGALYHHDDGSPTVVIFPSSAETP